MSSYTFKAVHKATGDTHEIIALDNFFGARNYGYIVKQPGSLHPVWDEEDFIQQYEELP